MWDKAAKLLEKRSWTVPDEFKLLVRDCSISELIDLVKDLSEFPQDKPYLDVVFNELKTRK